MNAFLSSHLRFRQRSLRTYTLRLVPVITVATDVLVIPMWHRGSKMIFVEMLERALQSLFTYSAADLGEGLCNRRLTGPDLAGWVQLTHWHFQRPVPVSLM